ncbi:hypothetical protein EB093_08525 [bacterium]|nr:hypothetical protein [bacterium]
MLPKKSYSPYRSPLTIFISREILQIELFSYRKKFEKNFKNIIYITDRPLQGYLLNRLEG